MHGMVSVCIRVYFQTYTPYQVGEPHYIPAKTIEQVMRDYPNSVSYVHTHILRKGFSNEDYVNSKTYYDGYVITPEKNILRSTIKQEHPDGDVLVQSGFTTSPLSTNVKKT